MSLLHALLHWPPAPAGGLAPGPISRVLDSVGFDLLQPLSWSPLQAGFFSLAVMGALGFLNNIVPLLFARSRSIPAQGSHLDALSPRDRAFLAFNRLASIPFSYHFVRAAWVLPSIAWCVARGWPRVAAGRLHLAAPSAPLTLAASARLPEQLSVRNALLPLPVLFVTYDLFYASFHRALHLQRRARARGSGQRGASRPRAACTSWCISTTTGSTRPAAARRTLSTCTPSSSSAASIITYWRC